jgi:hypothetical protein
MKKFNINKNATINRWSYSNDGGHKLQFNGINDFVKYLARVVLDTQHRKIRKEELSYVKRKLFDIYPQLRNDHELYHPNITFDLDPKWVDSILDELSDLNFDYQLAVQAAVKDIYYPKPVDFVTPVKKPVNKFGYKG